MEPSGLYKQIEAELLRCGCDGVGEQRWKGSWTVTRWFRNACDQMAMTVAAAVVRMMT